MADIQCAECGTVSATPRAHQNHICRPVEPIRIAEPVRHVAPTAREMRAQGMSPAEYRTGMRFDHNGAPMVRKERVNDRMANIVLCDRCGSIATSKVAGYVTYQANPTVEEEGLGLCPGCSEALWRFLREEGVAPKALTAYRQPFDPETVAEPVTNPAETTERAILDGD